MLVDARNIPKDQLIHTDVCIIGAGPAGITLARMLRNSPIKISLLESGGFEYEENTQALCDGDITGEHYWPLNTARLRYFGGSSNHWDGACVPMNKIDFEHREWVPHSGWPFGLDHLVPYYQRAQEICQIGPFNYSTNYWDFPDRRPAVFTSDRLINTLLQGSPPTRFGQVYRSDILGANNIDTYLHANVVEIEPELSSGRIRRLRVSSLEKNLFFVTAKVYVLAAGGIENPRILLNSNSIQKAGLGNQNDLVGRFFMEHPFAWSGIILPSHFDDRFYGYYLKEYRDGERKGDVIVNGYLTPSEKTLREERLLNCAIGLRRIEWKDVSPGMASLQKIIDGIEKGQIPDHFTKHLEKVIKDIDDITVATYRKATGKQYSLLEVRYWAEQTPNPISRVTLASDLNIFGNNIVALDWRLQEQDKRSLLRVHQILAEEFGRAGYGRLRLDFDGDASGWKSNLYGSYHHMGTTRMHEDPKQGVVNADCRVHGIENLYIAGSSVFPTSSYVQPTLTIVALALRLADHIRQTLA